MRWVEAPRKRHHRHHLWFAPWGGANHLVMVEGMRPIGKEPYPEPIIFVADELTFVTHLPNPRLGIWCANSGYAVRRINIDS